MEVGELLETLSELAERAEMYDRQRCGDDRYDEGYADAMYEAIALITKDL